MLYYYYKQNGYSPLYALNGSISLLLEIPFFMAAYHFLSHLEVLHGASFGPIADMGAPDGLIHIGSLTLNLLPILMTTINCVSAAIYLKGFPIKDKIQTFGLALIFLVLLYDSPAGLVVYWTCNNIFSLVKNVFYKLKNPRKVLGILCAVASLVISAALIFSGVLNSRKKYVFVIVFMLCSFIPLAFGIFKKKRTLFQNGSKTVPANSADSENTNLLFVLSGLFLTVLLGILIPSSVIASSPAEFVEVKNYQNPLHFLLNSTCYAAGFFLLWSGIIYGMMKNASRRRFAFSLLAVSVIALLNYMCFGRNLGNLSAYLVFDNGISFSLLEKIVNFALPAFIVLSLAFVYKILGRRRMIALNFISLVLAISATFLSIPNFVSANRVFSGLSYAKNQTSASDDSRIKPIFKLSRTGKNVVVFMLDRAISGFIPYFLSEKPELKSAFSGFTWYPNTLSFGGHTNFGSPPLFGGYEYTPSEMNRKNTQALREKQNEALCLMPVIFLENGFEVTVCDPPYANYQQIPDLSIYDKWPQIKSHITMGSYTGEFEKESGLFVQMLDINRRNFFCYSILKCLPLFLQPSIYDSGKYYNTTKSLYSTSMLNSYSVLHFLPKLSEVTENSSDTLIMIDNETTHNPCVLNLPDYTPSAAENASDYSFGGGLHFSTGTQKEHYHVNMSSILRLGEWFDWMKENCVYDNTRIIIVSDHGYTTNHDTEGLALFSHMMLENPKIDVSFCNPLLLVKDFGAAEFTSSDGFMTQADVPSLAFSGLVSEVKNPFTGNKIDMRPKNASPQLVTSSHNHYITRQFENTFDTSDGKWFSVHDNIFDEKNWEIVTPLPDGSVR